MIKVGGCLIDFREQGLLVARQQRVGGEHQVVFANLAESGVPVRAVQHQYAQLRGELGGLTLPVTHQAGWRDHQGRLGQLPIGLQLGQTCFGVETKLQQTATTCLQL